MFNDILVPLYDTYSNLYDFIMIDAAGYGTGDDLVNASSEISAAASEAIVAFQNYFSDNGEASATVEPSEEAIEAAQEYLEEDEDYYNRNDLMWNLVSDGYSTEEAAAAAENCGADWETYCTEEAEYWLDSMFGYSYEDLVEELEYDDFTSDEIAYAINIIEPDWNEQAVIAANFCLSTDTNQTRDRDNMVEVLKIQGFTDEQAEYGADHCDGDWN